MISLHNRVRNRAGGPPAHAQRGTVRGVSFDGARYHVAVQWDGMTPYTHTWHPIDDLIAVPPEESTVTSTAPKAETLDLIAREVEHARAKFPDNKHLFAALVEEVGELAKAMLQDRPAAEIILEAKQTAAVAIRVIEEGDAAFDVKDWKTTP